MTNLTLSEIEQRIQELIHNPSLGCKHLAPGVNEKLFSNCHGTTLYTLGLEDEIKRYESVHELEECDNGRKAILFYRVEGRPGYVSPSVMEEFLKDKCMEVKSDDISIGIVSISDCRLQHSGVCYRNKKVFHQVNIGSIFLYQDINEVIREQSNRIGPINLRFFAPNCWMKGVKDDN